MEQVWSRSAPRFPAYAQYERSSVRYWIALLRWRGSMPSPPSRSAIVRYFEDAVVGAGVKANLAGTLLFAKRYDDAGSCFSVGCRAFPRRSEFKNESRDRAGEGRAHCRSAESLCRGRETEGRVRPLSGKTLTLCRRHLCSMQCLELLYTGWRATYIDCISSRIWHLARTWSGAR
jgi:hypothetical protein